MKYFSLLAVVAKLSLSLATLAPTFSVKRVDLHPRKETVRALSIRLLFFKNKNCSGCNAVHRYLNDETLVSVKWTRGYTPDKIIQYVDTKEHPELVDRFSVHTLPTWILVKDGKEIGRVDPDAEDWNPIEFIRLGAELYNEQFPDPVATQRGSVKAEFHSPPLTPLYYRATDLPRHQIQVAPPVPMVSQRRVSYTRPVHSGYPIRGQWWTGCPSWRHMTTGVHRGKFPTQWLQSLSYAELQSLHSDDHEGRVKWQFVPAG